MKTKRLFAASSAAAVATASCLSAVSVPVHADAGTFAGAIDYIEALSGSEATALMSTPGGAVVAGLLLGVYLCSRNPLATGSPYDVSSEIYYTGIYKVDGVEKIGCIRTTASNYYPADGGYTFATSDDWEISTTCGAPIRFEYDVNNERFACHSQWDTTQIWTDSKGFFQSFYSGKDWWSVSTSIGYFVAPSLTRGGYMPASVDDWNSRPRLLGQISAVDSLGGELDPANPELYVAHVVRPYVETNYPDLVYLLPEAPYEPEYPTDFVTGIPKDWTITNPQLPTMPDLSLDIPDATLPSMDVSSELGQYTDGVRFWWALTGWVMDTLGIKTLVIVFLIIGIAVFALFKIGG